MGGAGRLTSTLQQWYEELLDVIFDGAPEEHHGDPREVVRKLKDQNKQSIPTMTTHDPRAHKLREILAVAANIRRKDDIDRIDLSADIRSSLQMDATDITTVSRGIDKEFGVDIQLVDACGNDVLALLNMRLGPAEPTHGLLLQLTDDQFIARYHPEQTPEGDYCRQRDWHDADDLRAINAAVRDNRVWTAMDDDEGEFCIASGMHFVNRLYYIITEKPAENPDWVIVAQDPDESPRVLLKVDWDLTNDGDNPNPEGVDVVGPPELVVVRLYDVERGLEDAMADKDAMDDWLATEYGFYVNSYEVVRVLAPGEEV